MCWSNLSFFSLIAGKRRHRLQRLVVLLRQWRWTPLPTAWSNGGDVKLKLYKGNMINAGQQLSYTLYDEQIASFGEDEDYNQADAATYNLFGLSIKERASCPRTGLTSTDPIVSPRAGRVFTPSRPCA